MIPVSETLSIDENNISFTFIRSTGPGGQNVNKVATAAQLRFDIENSDAIPVQVKKRLIRIAGSKMTAKGELIITARRFRTQEANRSDAIDRLVEMIRRAEYAPKKRNATMPTIASREKRLASKRILKQKKEQRKRLPDE